MQYTLLVKTEYGNQEDSYSANGEHGLKILATVAIEHRKSLWRIVRNKDNKIVASGETDMKEDIED